MDVVAPEAADKMQVDAVPVDGQEDLYTRLKTLQKQVEILGIQVRTVISCLIATLLGLCCPKGSGSPTSGV